MYFERVSVAGITFGYEGTKSVGYCKAETIDYFSTCGGFVDGEHLGAEYVRKLAKMFGIDVVKEYIVEGLDVNPEKRNEIANYFK